MFGVSFTELIVIAIVAFLIIGPKKLAHSAEDIGKMVHGLKERITHYRQTVLMEQVDLSSFFDPQVELNKNLEQIKNSECVIPDKLPKSP